MYLVFEKNEKNESLKVSTKMVFVKKRVGDIESAQCKLVFELNSNMIYLWIDYIMKGSMDDRSRSKYLHKCKLVACWDLKFEYPSHSTTTTTTKGMNFTQKIKAQIENGFFSQQVKN